MSKNLLGTLINLHLCLSSFFLPIDKIRPFLFKSVLLWHPIVDLRLLFFLKKKKRKDLQKNKKLSLHTSIHWHISIYLIPSSHSCSCRRDFEIVLFLFKRIQFFLLSGYCLKKKIKERITK